MKTIITAVFAMFLVLSCTSTKTLTDTQKKELISWGNEKPFEIVSHRALPVPTMAFSSVANSGLLAPGNSAGSIDITGTGNYFRMRGDTISAQLPYFGERRFGYNNNSNELGIRFDGLPKIKEINFNEKKQRVDMHFSIKQKSDNEIYDIRVYVYASRSARIDVTSSERTAISFVGNLEPLEIK